MMDAVWRGSVGIAQSLKGASGGLCTLWLEEHLSCVEF